MSGTAMGFSEVAAPPITMDKLGNEAPDARYTMTPAITSYEGALKARIRGWDATLYPPLVEPELVSETTERITSFWVIDLSSAITNPPPVYGPFNGQIETTAVAFVHIESKDSIQRAFAFLSEVLESRAVGARAAIVLPPQFDIDAQPEWVHALAPTRIYPLVLPSTSVAPFAFVRASFSELRPRVQPGEPTWEQQIDALRAAQQKRPKVGRDRLRAYFNSVDEEES